MLQTMAKVFGFVLLTMGVLGFIPPFVPNDHLLGIFHVDALHNLVHLGSGVVALVAGYSSYGASRTYFRVFGVVYALVALLGLFSNDGELLGIMANNMADTLLHVVIAASALALGFGNFDLDSAET